MKKLLTVLLSCLMVFISVPKLTVGAEEKENFTFYYNSFNEESLTVFENGKMVKIYHDKLDHTIKISNQNFTGTYEIKPQWWPGNPNPQPGTDDWLFLHQEEYGRQARNYDAEECALRALGLSAVDVPLGMWITRAVFTVGSFAKSFGASVLLSYGHCLWEKGYRLW